MNGTTGNGMTTNGARRDRRSLPAASGTALAALVVLVTVLALAGCEPAPGGGLNAGSVAHTTDRTATSTFERLGVGVRWLSCRAALGS